MEIIKRNLETFCMLLEIYRFLAKGVHLLLDGIPCILSNQNISSSKIMLQLLFIHYLEASNFGKVRLDSDTPFIWDTLHLLKMANFTVA